jgi:sarcosine oxidase
MSARHRSQIIIVGLGAVGAAALYHLARQGVSVLGLDRFTPPHARGSSHGRTRIYRQAYYEAPAYVPLARRALELWRALEHDGAQTLFANTGALTIGPEAGELFSGAFRSAQEHGIAHEVLSTGDVMRRFPAFRPPPGTVALFEPTGGVLFAESCVAAHLALARTLGADVRTDEPVVGIESRNGGDVVVTTAAGTYEAERVIVAAGAWMPALAGFERAFRITRETVHWFAAGSPNATASSCPVAMIEYGAGPLLYTIPDFGDGFKAGLHHAGRVADPMSAPAPVTAEDSAAVASAVERYAPGGAGSLRESTPCYYTTSPDHHFVIGEVPRMPGVILASACSGHGFKFAPALGEAIAKLALGRESGLPAELFDVARLTS